MVPTTPSPYVASFQSGAVTIQPGAQVQAISVNGLAVNNQNGLTSVWMNVPQPIAGVPPGLEYLTMVDRIVVHQLLEWKEILFDYHVKNKYVLLNANGEQVYYAFEESGLCTRCWCAQQRGFTMHVVDNFKSEVIRVTRPFKCWGGGCYGCLAGIDCCSYDCTVEAPPGNIIGSVVQRQACCASSFEVKDASGQVLLDIDGPVMSCGRNVEFRVTTPSGAPCGEITKNWRGLVRELFTNADKFSVSFPLDLDVKLKALLLGATFMIDFAEFENTKNT
nr:Scramblase domain containing protein [Haemonchus contortus]